MEYIDHNERCCDPGQFQGRAHPDCPGFPIEDTSHEQCWFWEDENQKCHFEQVIAGLAPCESCPWERTGDDSAHTGGLHADDVRSVAPGGYIGLVFSD